MNFVSLFLIALVEGVTEFLPISSTGHMIVVARFLHLPQTDTFKAFEVIIQLAAILAIAWFYRSYFRWSYRQLWLKIALAFLPLGLVGFLFADLVKSLFSVSIVAFMFIIGGLALIWLEKRSSSPFSQPQKLQVISWLQALKIGFWQTLALIPGTSRSGATIFGGMMSGLTRQTATEFSFLLALPVMLAASGYDLFKHRLLFTTQDWRFLGFASLISFFSAYLTVKLFLRYLQKHNFNFFGWYRIIFGLLLLLFYL